MAETGDNETPPELEANDSTDAMDEFIRYGLCPLLGSPKYARWLACGGTRCRREAMEPPYLGCKAAFGQRKADSWPSIEVDP
jgi:hypothetical protein